MFKRILIANRGEIALRLIRCCTEMDIETVLIHSTADNDSLPVKLATTAICIGGPKGADSYLNMDKIIDIALRTECEAIHPGYGFLSENPTFAKLCEENNLKFIGPSAEVISKMGDKSCARDMMIKAGVPVVPGSDGLVKDEKEAKEVAERLGYPVLIKASAGGGGRGMRRCFNPEDIEATYSEAKAEAKACFGNDDMYMEKLILNPKHIEFQILADAHGNVIHLGERDCSVQRRNQKMIEESPSKALSDELRQKMGEAAIKAASAAGYENAGTIEFVLDKEGNFYFIEMNTRIQVEHPVTEFVTGTDLIKEQLRIASGMKLSYTQDDIKLNGVAIECRINAEDPLKDFMPTPGKINFLHLPQGNGVRVDTHIYSGYEISPYYDSMVAKVIVHAPTRLEAIKKMRECLEEIIIDGITTTEPFLHLIMYQKDYLLGNFDTSFIDTHMDDIMEWAEGAAAE